MARRRSAERRDGRAGESGPSGCEAAQRGTSKRRGGPRDREAEGRAAERSERPQAVSAANAGERRAAGAQGGDAGQPAARLCGAWRVLCAVRRTPEAAPPRIALGLSMALYKKLAVAGCVGGGALGVGTLRTRPDAGAARWQMQDAARRARPARRAVRRGAAASPARMLADAGYCAPKALRVFTVIRTQQRRTTMTCDAPLAVR